MVARHLHVSSQLSLLDDYFIIRGLPWPCTNEHKLRQKHNSMTSVYFPDHHILINYDCLWVTAISIKVVHEQSGKVEYERERLLGIANKLTNFQRDSQQPFALVFDFSALLVDNLNWNSCITSVQDSLPTQVRWRLFSTHRKTQLARLLQVLSSNHNARQFILIRCKYSQRACELVFAMSGKEPYHALDLQ